MSITIRKEDFEEAGYHYIFYNLTSNTEFLEYEKLKAYEFYEDGMKVVAPSGLCSKGHSALIAIFEKENFIVPDKINPGGKIPGSLMVGIGKIKDLITEEDSEDVILDLKFNQYPIEVWQQIANKFHERQDVIEDIVEKINR